jgi:hypothetical protein
MDFELPVFYKELDLALSAQLVQLGYTHRIVIDVYGQEVLFVPDEERCYSGKPLSI